MLIPFFSHFKPPKYMKKKSAAFRNTGDTQTIDRLTGCCETKWAPAGWGPKNQADWFYWLHAPLPTKICRIFPDTTKNH